MGRTWEVAQKIGNASYIIVVFESADLVEVEADMSICLFSLGPNTSKIERFAYRFKKNLPLENIYIKF